MRTIRALEARSLKQHEQLLEDTQVLADIYDGLVQQNADRIAEIAALKKEIATIRAERRRYESGTPLARAFTNCDQRLPSRLAHSQTE